MESDSKINVEIKARCSDPEQVRAVLIRSDANYVGLDRQTDTYFRVREGRLKLRTGTIENSLIYYRRADEQGPRPSIVQLHRPSDPAALRRVLEAALEVDIVVEKLRHIYFLENVKVHVDEVDGLGHFVEVEAIGTPGPDIEPVLERQCVDVMGLLGITSEDLVGASYSDLLRDENAAGA